VLWIGLVGALVLATTLAVLRQDALLGWFIPAKAPVEARTPPPARKPHPVPSQVAAAPAPGPTALAPTLPVPAPVAPTPVAAPPAVGAPAGAQALTEIRKITWKQDLGETVVTLEADGALRRQDWAHYRIDGDPPRELVKLFGVTHPFPSPRLVAGTRQLLQVRTGSHDGPHGNELHVVLDLTGLGVEVTGIEAEGKQLHVHLKGK
jgi:hypothetical protein